MIKFCSTEYIVENLEKGQLFFNNIHSMNDPFEGIFRYRLSADKANFSDFYRKYFSAMDKLDYYFENQGEFVKSLNRSFEWRSQNNSVSCFSDAECLSSILMWGHYAEKHAGVCLVFDETLNFVTPPELNSEVKIVAYPTGPYKVKYIEGYLDEDPLAKGLNHHNFLTTKFNIWEYEKESRFIAPIRGAYLFQKKSLREIVFGLNSNLSIRNDVAKVVDELYSGVSLKRVRRVDSQFKLGIELMT